MLSCLSGGYKFASVLQCARSSCMLVINSDNGNWPLKIIFHNLWLVYLTVFVDENHFLLDPSYIFMDVME